MCGSGRRNSSMREHSAEVVGADQSVEARAAPRARTQTTILKIGRGEVAKREDYLAARDELKLSEYE